MQYCMIFSKKKFFALVVFILVRWQSECKYSKVLPYTTQLTTNPLSSIHTIMTQKRKCRGSESVKYLVII